MNQTLFLSVEFNELHADTMRFWTIGQVAAVLGLIAFLFGRFS